MSFFKSIQKIKFITRQKLIVIALILGALSWLIESFIHSQFFYTQYPDFLNQLFLPDAHEIWMRLAIIALFISFAVYAQRIIEALIAAENAVRLAHGELTQIFETSADGMRLVDRDFNVLRVNKTFLSLIGLSRAEIEGKKCYDIFSGHICHTDRCPMTRIIAGEERIEYDEVKVRKDSRPIPCIVTATPFRDGQGRIVGIVEDFKDISERKEAEEQLHQSRQQLRELASHAELTREEERRRMAREIHDELGQSLTVLKMDVHWLTHHVPQPPAELTAKLRGMNLLLDETVRTVQRLAAELRPGLLDELGLSAAIEWQANMMQERVDIKFNVRSTPEDITLDDIYSTTLFRIFQETLTNIVRHSQATEVEVALHLHDNNVSLSVHDNGCGITPEQINDPHSLGLIGMKERINFLGGSLTIRSEQGVAIHVVIPL